MVGRKKIDRLGDKSIMNSPRTNKYSANGQKALEIEIRASLIWSNSLPAILNNVFTYFPSTYFRTVVALFGDALYEDAVKSKTTELMAFNYKNDAAMRK